MGIYDKMQGNRKQAAFRLIRKTSKIHLHTSASIGNVLYTRDGGKLSDNAYRLPRGDHKVRQNPWSERRKRRTSEAKGQGFTKYCGITFIVPVGVKVRYSSSAGWRRNS